MAKTPEGRPSSENKRGKARAAPAGESIVIAKLGGVPLDLLLTAVRGPVRLEIEEAGSAEIEEAKFRIDKGEWTELDRAGRVWRAELTTQELVDGQHTIDLQVHSSEGEQDEVHGAFRVRNRAR